ncbi:hypothetical protein TNCV_4235741 [Trichonephila clavipes]|nr:hypothetical protein TNCV_4235741 [Trichonephila clavipes]
MALQCGMITKGFYLLANNISAAHSSRDIVEESKQCAFEILLHQHYYFHHTPNNNVLFPRLIKQMQYGRFDSKKDAVQELEQLFSAQPKRFGNTRIFQQFHHQLRETRLFYVTRHDAGRRRLVRTPSLEESILNVVVDRPDSSTRAVAHHISQTVYGVLNENRLHLFIFSKYKL